MHRRMRPATRSPAGPRTPRSRLPRTVGIIRGPRGRRIQGRAAHSPRVAPGERADSRSHLLREQPQMFTRLVAAGVAALAAATLAVAPSSDASPATRVRECGVRNYSHSLEVVGLTSDQRLVCFRANKPGNARDIAPVSGLVQDTKLVGIDYRPATGDLYGVGDQAGLYIIDPATATASLAARANVALQGSSFGVDFNPAADRLRIVSDTGQNLRANVANGVTVEDPDLNYPAPAVPPATGITGAAYTNNDLNPDTATTLFDIDSNLDQVDIQSPANAGTVVATGKLLVDAAPDLGFDIYSKVREGRAVDNQGLAVLISGDRTRLYGINLLTGRALQRGTFNTKDPVVDIAFPL